MTELLNAQVEDVSGAVRGCRDEILNYIGLLAAAGNETTTRLIGWAGKVLAEHPDQRGRAGAGSRTRAQRHRRAAALRVPSPVQARYVTRDVEHHGNRCRKAACCC